MTVDLNTYIYIGIALVVLVIAWRKGWFSKVQSALHSTADKVEGKVAIEPTAKVAVAALADSYATRDDLMKDIGRTGTSQVISLDGTIVHGDLVKYASTPTGIKAA